MSPSPSCTSWRTALWLAVCFVAWQPEEALPNRQRPLLASLRANYTQLSGQVEPSGLPPCLQELCLCCSSTSAERCCTSWTSGFELRISLLTKLRKVASWLSGYPHNNTNVGNCTLGLGRFVPLLLCELIIDKRKSTLNSINLIESSSFLL